MNTIDDKIPGFEVQVKFEPELIQPGEPADLVVRLVPTGEYKASDYRFLEERELALNVAFKLNGFEYEPPSANVLPQASFVFLGREMEKRIPLLAGKRVAGTDYLELYHMDNSFMAKVEGHIAPGGEGCYLRKPGGDGNYISFKLPNTA
jgi:hypothetical protein